MAVGFGSGLAPKAPGTFGTLVAVPIYVVLQYLPVMFYIAALFIIIVFGVWICAVTARDLGVPDHQSIVWDEIAGFCLAMTAMPLKWYWVLAGFLLFRLFDIWKPWPISWLDKSIHGGSGIMIDDLVAGLYVLAILHSCNMYLSG